MPGRDGIPGDPPEGIHAVIVMRWKDGKIVGLQVQNASSMLHADLLARAQRLGSGQRSHNVTKTMISGAHARSVRDLHTGRAAGSMYQNRSI